jgi:adenylate cyclase class 2
VVENGPAMAQVLEALGYNPSFRYEKYRSEWSDSNGHVVVDETPIGSFGEIEGAPEWIDATAQRLNISTGDYIKASYAELFMEWKRKNQREDLHMLFGKI